MVIAALLSTNFRLNRRALGIILALGAGLLAGGCDRESVAEAYRASSDWMNDVPAPSEPSPWRLSKRPADMNAPFPNLGDVPPRPAGLATPGELEEQVRLLQMDAGATATPPAADAKEKAVFADAPRPATIEPLRIPKQVEANR